MRDLSYTTEVRFKEVEVSDYVRDYYDPKRFLPLCMECPQYNKSWTCPPFSKEPPVLNYKKVIVLATKIYPHEKALPIGSAINLMLPVRKQIEVILKEMERRDGGFASDNVGECVHCAPGTCTRLERKVCRHPELIRPSLEAYGFDLGKTLKELFDIELKWSQDGLIPEYLTLICAFFHDHDTLTAELKELLNQQI